MTGKTVGPEITSSEAVAGVAVPVVVVVVIVDVGMAAVESEAAGVVDVSHDVSLRENWAVPL